LVPVVNLIGLILFNPLICGHTFAQISVGDGVPDPGRAF
jgi:hypothetical protein